MILEKNIAQSNEKKIQDNISKEQVNLGQFQSEEKQNQNNLQKQSIKITELGHELQIKCKSERNVKFKLFLLFNLIVILLLSTRFKGTQSFSGIR